MTGRQFGPLWELSSVNPSYAAHVETEPDATFTMLMRSEGAMATATITVRLTDADEVQALVNAAAAVLQEANDKGSISRQSMPLVQLHCALGSLSASLNALKIEARHEGK